MTGLGAKRQTNTELSSSRADGEGKDAGYTDDGDSQSNCGETTKHDRVEPVGSEHFGADIFKGGSALDGLVRSHVANDAGDGGDQSIGIHAGVNKQAAAKQRQFLIGRIIRNL